MMNIKDIVSMSPTVKIEQQDLARLGDKEACKAFVLMSLWEAINKNKESSMTTKVELLKFFEENMEIKWQKT